jgi:ribosome recycling factor
MADEPDISDIERRMHSAVEVLKTELGGLRTGRASVSMLDPIVVSAYGNEMRLKEVGTVSAPEARLLTVQVWDRSNVAAVEKAIRAANLGVNPMVDGQLVRVPIPELTGDRRKELARVAHKYAEQARVAVRNVRRDGMERLKKMEKDGDLSQDDHNLWADEIQDLTDKSVKQIDDMLTHKEREITQV